MSQRAFGGENHSGPTSPNRQKGHILARSLISFTKTGRKATGARPLLLSAAMLVILVLLMMRGSLPVPRYASSQAESLTVASSQPISVGTALTFDGVNDYVTFGTAPGLGVVTFTLEVWFKREGAGVSTNTGSGGIPDAIPLVTKGRSESDGSNVDMNYFLGIQASTNKLAADFEEGASGVQPGQNHPIIGTTTITNNVWHHSAVTYNEMNLRLYLDGLLEAEIPLDDPPRWDSIQHAALATAMDSTGTPSGFFNGTLDEARVWNYARSGQQIRMSKNQEITAVPGLVGRWGLDEGSGTAVADSSGHGNNGTATNGPLWVTGYTFPQDSSAPSAPQNLAAAGGAGIINLTWDSNSEPDLAGYNVYRSASSPVLTTGTPLNGENLLTSPAYTDAALPGNTTYYYAVTAVDSSGNVSPLSVEASATTHIPPTGTATATPDPNDVVMVGAGDIASCTSTGDEATAALLDNIPGNAFTLGDNVYPDGTAAEFANCYDPTWGRHKARTRPVSGNHDYNTSGASGYYNYFGATAGDPSKGYYSYDLGIWHVVVLNSECAQVGGCEAGSPQETWLRADLAAHSASNALAMWHKPRFSSGNSGNTNTFVQSFWDAMYEYGVDIVLNGHDHIYERFAPQNASGQADPNFGIREFIVGTGGASHQSLGLIAPNSQVRNSSTFGVFKLILHTASYDWQFIPEAGKTFTDSGQDFTHGPPPANTPTGTPTATRTRTATLTNTPTYTPSSTPTDTPTFTPTYTPTFTSTVSSTHTPTNTPTSIPTDTPTNTLTNTPTSTPTSVPMLIGHLVWWGRPDQPSARQQLPLSLTLRLQSGGAASEFAGMSTDASGFFTVSLGSLPNGLYDWRVKGPTYLAVTGTLVLAGTSTTSVEMSNQRPGDIDGDNSVGLSDFTALNSTFGKLPGQPGYDARADYDGNGGITLGDFNLLKTSFGALGAGEIRPGN